MTLGMFGGILSYHGSISKLCCSQKPFQSMQVVQRSMFTGSRFISNNMFVLL
jgi:hypothetical protein